MVFNVKSFIAEWNIPGKRKEPLTADEYIKYVTEKYKNRLVYDAELSNKQREPMIETYTTLRKDRG